jgi:hypothetical protein
MRRHDRATSAPTGVSRTATAESVPSGFTRLRWYGRPGSCTARSPLPPWCTRAARALPRHSDRSPRAPSSAGARRCWIGQPGSDTLGCARLGPAPRRADSPRTDLSTGCAASRQRAATGHNAESSRRGRTSQDERCPPAATITCHPWSTASLLPGARGRACRRAGRTPPRTPSLSLRTAF